MTIRHLPKGWFAKPSPMALGINRTLYWLRVPITWGLELSWFYRPGIGVAYISCRCINCVWDGSLDYTGFTNPLFIRLLLLGEAICISVVWFRVCIKSWNFWIFRNWIKYEIKRRLIDLESFYCGDEYSCLGAIVPMIGNDSWRNDSAGSDWVSI